MCKMDNNVFNTKNPCLIRQGNMADNIFTKRDILQIIGYKRYQMINKYYKLRVNETNLVTVR